MVSRWVLLVVGLLVVGSCGHNSINSGSNSSSVVAKQVHLDVVSFDHCRFGPSDFTAVGLPAMQLRDKPQREVFYSKMHNKEISADNCYYVFPVTKKDDDSSQLVFVISRYLLEGKPMPVSQISDAFTVFDESPNQIRVTSRVVDGYEMNEIVDFYPWTGITGISHEDVNRCGAYVQGLAFFFNLRPYEDRTAKLCPKAADFMVHVLG